MKFPFDIDTPLDRRAATIDILAGELERKNKNTAGWLRKFEKQKMEIEELHGRINELENECLTLEEKIYEQKQTLSSTHETKSTKKRRASSNGKANSHTTEDKY